MLKTYKVTLKENGCVVKVHGGIKANDALSAIDQVSVFATSNQEWIAKELKLKQLVSINKRLNGKRFEGANNEQHTNSS